jgi:hypothetical protein
MDNLEHLVYGIPLIFTVLSLIYKFKFDKLRYTGKIPRIIYARQRQVLFFYLAILSALIVLIVTRFPFLLQNILQDS